jgi:hypothetical protein
VTGLDGRVSMNDQDLTTQPNALLSLGVDEKQIFVEHGLTGANRVPSVKP